MVAFNLIPLALGGASALGSFLAREDADQAAQEATNFMVQGQQQAGSNLVNALQAGQAARMGAFEPARDALTSGTQAAIGALREGTTGAVGTQRDTLARALERLDPELLSARGAQNLLNDALGVNGPEAQAQFFGNFQDDPGFQAELQNRINAVDRSAASRGQLLSGRTIQHVADTGQLFQRGAFQDRLNRLRQAAAPAADVAARGATAITGTGTNIANALLAQGRNIANLEGSQGTNLANLLLRQGEAAATGAENLGNVMARQDVNIANALARGQLQQGQNQTEFINALMGGLEDIGGGITGTTVSF